MISAGPSIKHLARFVNGYPFKPDDLGLEGYPVIRIRQLVDPEAEVDYAEPPTRAVWISDGDLVFSWSATLAVQTWDRGPALLNQHLYRVDPLPGVETNWLLYVLEVAVDRLKPLMHGSAMTHITQEMLWSITTALPSVATQRTIADFLDTVTARIDAVISKKRRMIGLVEDRWRAELRQELGRLGPDTVALRHIARVKRGQSPRPIDDPAYFDDAGTHGWVRIQDASKSDVYLKETSQYLSELGRAKSVLVGPGTLLVSIAASVGQPIITAMDCCYHDGWVGLLDLRAVPEFVYLSLVLPETFGGLGQIGTQANVNSDIVGRVCIPSVAMDRQRSFVETMFARRAHARQIVDRLNQQLGLLHEHRQALITASVTGEFEVPGVAA